MVILHFVSCCLEEKILSSIFFHFCKIKFLNVSQSFRNMFLMIIPFLGSGCGSREITKSYKTKSSLFCQNAHKKFKVKVFGTMAFCGIL